jgi:hypothetical protein
VNPQHIRWSDIVSKLASHTTPSPQVVPYEDWLQALTSASEQRPDEVSTLPAIKLLDFFQDIGRSEAKRPTFSTTNTEKVCLSLQACGPVSTKWMLLWMKQWDLDVDDKHPPASAARADSCSPLHSASSLVPTVWQT